MLSLKPTIEEAFTGSFSCLLVNRNVCQSLMEYAKHGQPVGHFLKAALSNDFMETVCRADGEMIRCLPEIARYLHCEMPSECHGSPERVAEWIKVGGYAKKYPKQYAELFGTRCV